MFNFDLMKDTIAISKNIGGTPYKQMYNTQYNLMWHSLNTQIHYDWSF